MESPVVHLQIYEQTQWFTTLRILYYDIHCVIQTRADWPCMDSKICTERLKVICSYPKLLEELKCSPHPSLCVFQSVAAIIPRTTNGGKTKGISTCQ